MYGSDEIGVRGSASLSVFFTGASGAASSRPLPPAVTERPARAANASRFITILVLLRCVSILHSPNN